MLEPQQILQNRYQLQSLLSKNAARQTWLATDLLSLEQTNGDTNKHRQVVVKLLAFGGDVQWDDLKLFEREAQILKQLEHPYIPQYIDYFSVDDRVLWFGLVEEFIPGDSLKNLLETNHRFSEVQVRQIARETLEILMDLHTLNPAILHRDIKPSNLILGDDEHIYLVDFGAVQDRAAKEGVTFTVVGTYGYAPIEQFGGKAVPASDLYALGTTLIHLLTGIPPADLPVSDMRIQFQERVNISSSLEYWLEKMIEPSVEKRFKTASQALEALSKKLVSRRQNGRIRLPINSKIIWRKTADVLSIKIPNPNNLFSLKTVSVIIFYLVSCWVSFSILLLLSSNLILAILLSLVAIAFLYQTLLYYFGYQKIVFNDNFFEVQLWLFKWCVRRQADSNENIQDVFQSVMQNASKNIFQVVNLEGREMVTIQTNATRYSFGLGLSAIECLWVAQEIKDWLR